MESKTKASLLAIALLLCTLVVAACGGGSDGEDGESAADGPIRIGFIGALTGPLSASGQNALAGLEAGVAYVNDQGAGRSYEVVSRDSAGDPTRAVAATRELTQDGVAAIYYTTEGFPGVQDVLNRTQTVGISPGIGPILDKVGDGNVYPWAFSTGTAAGTPAVAPHIAFAKANGGSIGELSEASAYGKAQSALTAAEVAKDPSLELVTEDFPTTSRDVSKQLGQLRASGVDTLVVWTYGQGLLMVTQGLKKIGWTPKLAGPLALADPAFVESAPPALLESAVAGPLPTTFLADAPGQAPTGIAGEFVQRYLAATGKEQFSGLDEVGAFSFDTAIVLDAAVTEAGETDGEKVKSALTSGMPIEGAQGRYVFGPDQRLGLSADQLGLFQAGETCSKGACVTVR